jgi:hypothetical protein
MRRAGTDVGHHDVVCQHDVSDVRAGWALDVHHVGGVGESVQDEFVEIDGPRRRVRRIDRFDSVHWHPRLQGCAALDYSISSGNGNAASRIAAAVSGNRL